MSFKHLPHLVAFMLSIASFQCTDAEAQGEDSSIDRPPNVVLILVDDLDWMDVACFGSLFYQTPNIEMLPQRGGNVAARGANFSLQDHGGPVWY